MKLRKAEFYIVNEKDGIVLPWNKLELFKTIEIEDNVNLFGTVLVFDGECYTVLAALGDKFRIVKAKTYVNKKDSICFDSKEFKSKTTAFNIGDIAYMHDCDWVTFEEEIISIYKDRNGKISYGTDSLDFSETDIDDWVFKSSDERLDKLTTLINYDELD